jgi:hypothetical protein
MFSPTPLTNSIGDVGGVAANVTGNSQTGAISSNVVSFGAPEGSSTITIETTGDPWLAIGYAAAMSRRGNNGVFSITAFDVNGAVLESHTRNFTPANSSPGAFNNAMVFVGVSSSSATPIYKVELTRSGPNNFGFFDNLTFQSVPDPDPELLPDLAFNGFTQVLGSPEAGCNAGIVTLSLTFQYHGADDYEHLFYRIVALDAPRTVPGTIGPDIAIPNADLGADAKLTMGETFTADLPICLPNLHRFNLLLDVYGSRIP